MSRKRVICKPLPENTVQYLDEPKIDFTNIPPKLRKSRCKSSTSVKPLKSANPEKQQKCSTSKNTTCLLKTDETKETPSFHNDWTTAATSIAELDPYVLYRLLLKRDKYFAPCSSDLMSFAIADYDTKNQDILKHHIHIVTRQTKGFTDKFAWVYSCTCDQANVTYLDSLPAHINTSSKEFPSKNCIHIDATQKLVETIDDVQEFTQSLFDDHCYDSKNETKGFVMWEIDFPEVCVGVFLDDDTPGVVGISSLELKCFTCESRHCHHCRKVNKIITTASFEEIPDVLLDIQKVIEEGREKIIPTYEYQSLSSSSILFRPPPSLQKYLLGNYDEFLIDDGFHHFWPDEEEFPSCPSCGGSWNEECFQQGRGEFIYLYEKYRMIKVKVYGKDCSNVNCHQKCVFDGGKISLLNMKTFLVHHSVLRDYMWHFLHGRCTLHSYFQVWKQHHDDIGCEQFSDMTYTKFRHSWYEYLKLLDISFDEEFQCSICKDYPSIVVCDATSLACQKSFVNWTECETDNQMTPIPGRYKDRVFIDDKQTRQMISIYNSKGFDDDEQFDCLKERLKKWCPSLTNLFQHIQLIGCMKKCPPEFAELLNTVSATSPVCAVLPPSEDILMLMRKITENSGEEEDILSFTEMKRLQIQTPILYQIIVQLRNVSHYIKPILKQMVSISQQTFCRHDSEVKNPEQTCVLNNDKGCYFPSLQQRRPRGIYVVDKGTKAKTGSECSKKSTRHPTLLPGIFTAFCSHGVCYGFQVMQCNESPNVPFTFFRTRFEKAPKVIIYDNACNLHNYALNRDPLFFKETQFVVDNLHWKNHKGCSKVYHAREHPSLSGINTQMVEQNNSKLKKLKSQLSYMNYENFVLHLKFFLWFCNKNIPTKY